MVEERRVRERLRELLGAQAPLRNQRLVVLGRNWQTAPWDEPRQLPETWGNAVPTVVLPQQPETELEIWMSRHLPAPRNAARFLYPKTRTSLFDEPGLWSCPERALSGWLLQRFRQVELLQIWRFGPAGPLSGGLSS